MNPQFGEIAYISEVNEADKIWRTGSHEQELGPRAEIVSLGMAGEDSASNFNFSKHPELSETRRVGSSYSGSRLI